MSKRKIEAGDLRHAETKETNAASDPELAENGAIVAFGLTKPSMRWNDAKGLFQKPLSVYSRAFGGTRYFLGVTQTWITVAVPTWRSQTVRHRAQSYKKLEDPKEKGPNRIESDVANWNGTSLE